MSQRDFDQAVYGWMQDGIEAHGRSSRKTLQDQFWEAIHGRLADAFPVEYRALVHESMAANSGLFDEDVLAFHFDSQRSHYKDNLPNADSQADRDDLEPTP